MSKSDSDRELTFDGWFRRQFSDTGGFTALVILVGIGEWSVTPLRSTYFHVIGDEIGWTDVAAMLSGSGVTWDGVVLATLTDEKAGGPVADHFARAALGELAARLDADRLELNRHHFFDRHGRRMQIEEANPQ